MTYLPALANRPDKVYPHVTEAEAQLIWAEARSPRIRCFIKTLWWCKENGQEPVTRNTFKNRLTEKGVGEGRAGNKGRFWTRIRLENSDNSDKTSGDFEAKVTKQTELPIKPPHEEQKLNTLQESDKTFVTQAQNKKTTPDYPTNPCRCGCTEFWLAPWGKYQCCRCHPEPKGE